MPTLTILSYPPADALLVTETVEGKFLRLHHNGKEYLLFASREAYRFHNQLLGQFLTERGIAHSWVDNETLQFDSATLQLLGGGRFRYSAMERHLDLYDNSQAYGRFDEAGLVALIATAHHPFAHAVVTIR